MNVSRSTLTRIYAKARAKVAESLVEGKQLVIEGGKVYFDSDWYKCNSCGSVFNQPEKGLEPAECPLCGSSDIIHHEGEERTSRVVTRRYEGLCACPSCGYEKKHEPQLPCREEICPVCGNRLMRKNNLLLSGL